MSLQYSRHFDSYSDAGGRLCWVYVVPTIMCVLSRKDGPQSHNVVGLVVTVLFMNGLSTCMISMLGLGWTK